MRLYFYQRSVEEREETPLTYVALDLREDDHTELSLGELIGMLDDFGYPWEFIKETIDRLENGEEVQLVEGYILFVA